MLPAAADIVEKRLIISPNQVSVLTVPPKLIAIIPPNPRIPPIIFIGVSLSFLKNNGTKSTVKNDAQAVYREVFVPLVKPIPMYVKIYCNPV